jgi:hypothetical protein
MSSQNILAWNTPRVNKKCWALCHMAKRPSQGLKKGKNHPAMHTVSAAVS